MITLHVQLARETETETGRPLLNEPLGLLHEADAARCHERVCNYIQINYTIHTIVLYSTGQVIFLALIIQNYDTGY